MRVRVFAMALGLAGLLTAAPATAATATLDSSSYLGGRADDVAFMAATDAAGNVYVTGWTDSPDFPTLHAAQPTYGGARDAFVAAFRADGTPIYATFLGGAAGDRGYYIRANPDGTAVVVGATSSTSFPRVNALQPSYRGGGSDAFLTVLDPTGAIRTSTFLGGGSFDAGNMVALYPGGDISVAGNTSSGNFPVTSGAVQRTKRAGADAFVMRLDPLGRSIRWSTYLGGNGLDKPYGLQVDASGNAYVSCLTASTDYPTRNAWQPRYAGGQDVTVTRYTPTGAMGWSTYFGGTGLDRVNGLDTDPAGNVYVAGQTSSTDMPTRNALQPVAGAAGDGFVLSFTSIGGLRYASYVGGARNDWFGGVVADAAGRAYAVGGSASPTVPTTGGFQTRLGGSRDGYLILLSTTGRTAVYGSFWGGANADGISSAALAPDGSLWIVGRTLSTNFPTAGASQPTLGGMWDGTVGHLGRVP